LLTAPWRYVGRTYRQSGYPKSILGRTNTEIRKLYASFVAVTYGNSLYVCNDGGEVCVHSKLLTATKSPFCSNNSGECQ